MKLSPILLTGAALIVLVAIVYAEDGSNPLPRAGALRLDLAKQDEIDVKRLAPSGAVCVGNAVADTAAMKAALALATANPGSTIHLPACAQPYIFNVGAGATGFAVPSQTTVRGDGARTVVTWTDAAPSGGSLLFASTGTDKVHATDISFRDMTVRGSACTTPSFVGNYPFLPYYVDGLSFRGVISECSRAMGIAARSSTEVSADANIVRFTMSDGINFAEDTGVSVRDNEISHTNDDAIGVHSDIFDPWGARDLVIITGNRLFDTQGIRVLAARVANISDNTGFVLKQFAIDVSTIAASGTSGSQEGVTAGIAIGIHNNIMANIVDRTHIDSFNRGATGLLLSGASARAGTLAAIPGEATMRSPGTVVDPYKELFANSRSPTVATAGTTGISVSGNQFIRTLPASDGKDPRYPKWSSFGFGRMWTRTGWADPSLSEADLSPNCIYLNGGVIHDVTSIGDMCRGVAVPIVLGQGVRYDAVFADLTATDFSFAGILANSTGITNVTVRDSTFDGDPYLKSASRGPGGTWAKVGAPFWIYNQQSKGGIRFIGNTIRNVSADTTGFDPSNPPATFYFAENVVQADASTFGGFSTANKGVGLVRATSPRLRYERVGSDPGASNYGQVLAMPSYP